MSKVVSDFLEGQSFSEQTDRTGVAERMAAPMCCLDAKRDEARFGVWAPSATGFFALGFGCEIAAFASTAPVNAALLRTVPPELRASAMALSIFAIHLFGDLWSPLALGALHDVVAAPVAMMGVPLALALSAGLWVPPGRANREALATT